MTIADLITKRDLQRNANFLLFVLQDHVMHLAPIPNNITDDAGWNNFVTSAQIVRDIDQIRKAVMK